MPVPFASQVSLAVFSKLKMQLRDKPSECTSDLEFGKWCSATCRLLYTLGQLCRYAADVLDNAREAPLPMEQALNVILCLFSTRLQWDGTCESLLEVDV